MVDLVAARSGLDRASLYYYFGSREELIFSTYRRSCEVVLSYLDAAIAQGGSALSQIERDQVRALIRDFEAIDYLHLDNIYGYRGPGCRSSAPDTPTVITSLSMAGQSKTLSHHDGCVGRVSEKLTALEDNIDKTVNTARWIAGKPRPGK